MSTTPQNVEQALVELGRTLSDEQILRDADILEQYSSDASEAAPHLPHAVIRARSTKDISAVMRIASKHRVPVTPRGAGTGRSGGAIPVAGGFVLSIDRMQQIKGIETTDLIAVVEPGVITGNLHRAVEAQGLFYPPDPNSLDSCTLAGNIAENAGGPRVFKYGPTRHYILGLEIVTADGSILSVGKRTIKGVTGYDLTALIVGSEGTLGIVSEATLRLLSLPEKIFTLAVLFPDCHAAARAITEVTKHHIVPRCMELLDDATLELLRHQAGIAVPDNAHAMIIMELDGSESQLEHELDRCGTALDNAGALNVLVAKDASERARLWGARREMSYALKRSAKFKLAEDVVVPRSHITTLLEHATFLSEKYSLKTATYGHAADANLHVNFLWDDPAQHSAVHAACRELFERVIQLGGTLSGEHGIGLTKMSYLGLEQSPEIISLQQKIKDLFDPHHILNPGKIFPDETQRYQARHGAC